MQHGQQKEPKQEPHSNQLFAYSTHTSNTPQKRPDKKYCATILRHNTYRWEEKNLFEHHSHFNIRLDFTHLENIYWLLNYASSKENIQFGEIASM